MSWIDMLLEKPSQPTIRQRRVGNQLLRLRMRIRPVSMPECKYLVEVLGDWSGRYASKNNWIFRTEQEASDYFDDLYRRMAITIANEALD